MDVRVLGLRHPLTISSCQVLAITSSRDDETLFKVHTHTHSLSLSNHRHSRRLGRCCCPLTSSRCKTTFQVCTGGASTNSSDIFCRSCLACALMSFAACRAPVELSTGAWLLLETEVAPRDSWRVALWYRLCVIPELYLGMAQSQPLQHYREGITGMLQAREQSHDSADLILSRGCNRFGLVCPPRMSSTRALNQGG